MAVKQNTLTKEEYESLSARLNYLTTVGRDEMAEKLKEARSHGDLSENAEYDEARNEQAKMEAEIKTLEADLKDVVILEESDLKSDRVHLGSIVTILDTELKEETEYKILGKSDISKNIISDLSPVGAAIMGKKVGNSVEVTLPSGKVTKMKIVKISK